MSVRLYDGHTYGAAMGRIVQDQFVVRMPDGMRDRLADRAKANMRSMNSEAVMILANALNAESKTTTGVQFGDQAPAAAHDTARKGDPVTHG